MPSRLLSLFLVAVPLFPSAAASVGFEIQPGVRALDPILQHQLAVYPVVSERAASACAPVPHLMTLAAGLERKEVTVRVK